MKKTDQPKAHCPICQEAMDSGDLYQWLADKAGVTRQEAKSRILFLQYGATPWEWCQLVQVLKPK